MMNSPAPARLRNRRSRWSEAEPHWYYSRSLRCGPPWLRDVRRPPRQSSGCDTGRRRGGRAWFRAGPAEVSMRRFAVRLLSSAGAEPAEAGEHTLLNSGPRTLAGAPPSRPFRAHQPSRVLRPDGLMTGPAAQPGGMRWIVRKSHHEMNSWPHKRNYSPRRNRTAWQARAGRADTRNRGYR